MEKRKILIIDDEMGICTALSFALEDKYEVYSATEPASALALIRDKFINLCLLDLKLEKYSGIDVLQKIKEVSKETVVIMMTAYGTIESSVEALQKGAYTYLTKPLNIEELYCVVEQALEFQRLNEHVEYLSNQLEEKYSYNGIVGKSHSMQQIFRMIEKLKDVDTGVIITGESGTGKELVAKALHFSGSRRKEHFEELNCAAIPEGLLEGELFGSVKGAYTGAGANRVGKLEYANNGTLFLDEIGDMPLNLQAKILRVLQEREYTPLGSNEKRKLNLRVISATNKDIKEMMKLGKFRQDLYYRLNVVEIHLPPLRKRKSDILLLCENFIKENNKSLKRQIKGVSRGAERILMSYDYPGNVRELKNIVEYAMVLCEGDIVQEGGLPEKMKVVKGREDGLFLEDLTGLPMREVEKKVIEANLKKNGGRRKQTAEVLGISEKGLRNKISEYGIRE